MRILLLGLCWVLCCGCTFAKEGYRVWIGPDKDVDWIDVVSEQQYVNGEMVETFRDNSPIQAVFLLAIPGCQWLLDKAQSTWLLRSATGQITHYTLQRLRPFERRWWDRFRAAVQPVLPAVKPDG